MKKRLPQQTKSEKPWTLQVSKRKLKSWGYCSYNRRAIVLSKDVAREGVDRQVFFHELFHKMFPWMSEEAVDHAATDADDALDIFDSMTNIG